MRDVIKELFEDLNADLTLLEGRMNSDTRKTIIRGMKSKISSARHSASWIRLRNTDGSTQYVCPKCNEVYTEKVRYCSTCGQYMGEIPEKRKSMEFIRED